MVPRRCWAAWMAYLLLIPSLTAAAECRLSRWEGVIQRDLEVLNKTTIHPELVERGRSQCHGGWTVLIVDNELYAIPFGDAPTSKRPVAFDLLAKALCKSRFPDVEFVLNAYERRAVTNASQASVVFTVSKDPAKDLDIVWPHQSLSFLHSIREHLAGGNKAQFFELDGYARTLPLRPR